MGGIKTILREYNFKDLEFFGVLGIFFICITLLFMCGEFWNTIFISNFIVECCDFY